MKDLFAISAVFFSFFAASPKTYASSPSVASAQRLETEWARLLNQGDMHVLGLWYEPDAWLLMPGAAPVKGRAAIQSALADMAIHVKGLHLETTSVLKLKGGAFVENGVARYDGPDQAASVPVLANYQVLWHCKRDGECLILRDMVSPLR